MKTAVSIPDKIFKSAEELAAKHGKSRSQIYARALERYIKEQDSRAVTKKLNEVYDNTGSLHPILSELQSRSLEKDEW